MEIIFNLFCLISAALVMEPMTWAVHKYVMHGFLWSLHEDHHVRDKSEPYEKNDLFAIFFSLPPFLMIYFGLDNHIAPLAFAGFGVALYGLLYFILHDLIFHRRFPRLHIKPYGRYLKRLTRAHVAHHRVSGKENNVSLGFLYASKNFEL